MRDRKIGKIGTVTIFLGLPVESCVRLIVTVPITCHVAHGRFDKLTYGGYPLHDNRGKLKLVGDLRDALKNN